MQPPQRPRGEVSPEFLTNIISTHLQLGIQVCVRRHHVFILFLPGDLDKRLLGFPVPLLELVHHGRVLALDEAVEVISGVAAAMTQTSKQSRD